MVTFAGVSRGLSMFVGLSVALTLLACSGGDGESGDPDDDEGDRPGPRLILHGALVAPPYEVGVAGHAVSVNGVTLASFGDRPPADPEPVDATSALDIFALLELGRLAYASAGGGDARMTAALAAVQARAETSDAAILTLDDVARLDVMHTSGATASFVPEPPDAAVRAPSDAERESAANDFAETLRTHLDKGGGLVVSSSLHILVPAAEVDLLLAATDMAMRGAGDQRRADLLLLYDDESTVDEIIEYYEPRATSARFVPAPALLPHQPTRTPAWTPAGGSSTSRLVSPRRHRGRRRRGSTRRCTRRTSAASSRRW